MARWTRPASWLLAAPLAVGLLPATGWAADDPVGSIAQEKDQILTPTLQSLAAGEPSPRGGSGPVTRSSDGPGAPLETATGRLLVDIRLTNTSPATLQGLRDAGGRVTFVDQTMRTATVAVQPSDLQALATSGPAVIAVREILQPMTNAACPSGDFVSEGVTQLRAALARAQFPVDGRGVTVGILSDSYDKLGGAATDVTNGELPGSGNPCGNTTAIDNLIEGPGGSSDEGRAMAQIVHDVAPGAKILFASAFFGESAFAQSIRDLAAAGADIIVDDVSYFSEPVFQDGVIAKAVRDVTADGVTYFSSAANSNLIIGGNRVASYEAPAYRPTSCPSAINSIYTGSTFDCHDFDPGGGLDALYNFTANGSLRYTLGWSEPQNGVSTDFDICLTNSTGTTAFGCAQGPNITTGLASEVVSGTGSGTLAWVIVRYESTGTPRLKLISHRSALTAVQYNTSAGGDIVGPTIFGHNASIPGVTVAAVPYNNSSALETFSSFGPALYCWGPVDGPTPSGPLNPCQSATVDLAATDGGINSFFPPGDGPPYRFYGTSAAAPHAAAVAALMLQGQRCLSPDGVKNALNASGRPVGSAPVDGAGAGLIDAVDAVTAGDCEAPAVNIGVSSGWFRTPVVSAAASARDNRVVTDLVCTGVSTQPVTGLNTTSAAQSWSVTGEGRYTVDCSARDLKGNTGPARVDLGIDMTPPVVTCRPAKLPFRGPGTVRAGVSDALSGPAAPTVSTRVRTNKVGRFTTTLNGADVAGNTASARCRYSVAVMPLLKGPAKAASGARKKFKVSRLPSKAKATWTVKSKGKTVQVTKGKANKAGVAKLKIRFSAKGKYVVSVKSAGASTRKVVRVA